VSFNLKHFLVLDLVLVKGGEWQIGKAILGNEEWKDGAYKW